MNNNNTNNNNKYNQLICSENFQNAVKELMHIHSNEFLDIEKEFQNQKLKWNEEKNQLLNIIEKLKSKNKQLKSIIVQQQAGTINNISMDSITNSSFGSNNDLTPIRNNNNNGISVNTSPGVFNKDSHRYNSDRIFDDFLSPSTPTSKSTSSSPISTKNNLKKTDKSPKNNNNNNNLNITTTTNTSTPTSTSTSTSTSTLASTSTSTKKRKKKEIEEEEKELDELDLPNEQPIQYNNNNNNDDNDNFEISKSNLSPNNSSSNNSNNIIDLDNEEDDSIKQQSSQQSTIINNLSQQRNSNKKIKIKEVVRNQEERGKLQGFDCAHCKEFYDAVLGDDETKKKQMLNQCSRHRHSDEPPSTPPGFWDFEFK